MSLSPLHRLSRSLRTAMFAIVLAFPLLGAGDCSFTGPDDGSSDSYDGTYALKTVDDQVLPFPMIYVDSRNRLMLTKGVWTLTGTTLQTQMWTTSIVNGASTSESKFNPERHTGTVTISGGTATGRLDSGSSVSTTFSSGRMLTSYSGHKMQFEKLP